MIAFDRFFWFYMTSVTLKLTCSRLKNWPIFVLQNCVNFVLFAVQWYIWCQNNQKFDRLSSVSNIVLVSLVTTNLTVTSHVLNFYWLEKLRQYHLHWRNSILNPKLIDTPACKLCLDAVLQAWRSVMERSIQV